MNTPKSVSSKDNAGPVEKTDGFSDALLHWYDRHGRVLPWRISPDKGKAGVKPDPYLVWLSEVMLQQTQVATVRDYYQTFTMKWPDVGALARAENDDVMKAWAGLGYYSRARNLKKCAEIIASDHGGIFPDDVESLKRLPGIGEYTAAAIAAIAFGVPVSVVDGNIERVMTRLRRVKTPVQSSKAEIREIVGQLLPPARPGDFAQALMDLGSGICTPKNPACSLCPVNAFCEAYEAGDPENYPVKSPKAEKPVRRGAAFVIQNQKGEVYLQKRPDKGLLGGMSEVPGTDWTARQDGLTGIKALPFKGEWNLAGTARHTFTHFHLQLEVWHCTSNDYQGNGWWTTLATLGEEALPSVMKKAIAVALPEAFKD